MQLYTIIHNYAPLCKIMNNKAKLCEIMQIYIFVVEAWLS